MPHATDKSWPQLTVDSWKLAGEMSMVIWLRSMKLMCGGPVAAREAQRMVSEKVAAHAELLPALMSGGMNQSVEGLTGRMIEHYGKPVRANRTRLTRRSR